MAVTRKQLLFTVTAFTPLGQAAENLSAGQSAEYTAGRLTLTIGTMGFAHWNMLWHYDPNRHELHAQGKDQADTGLNRHAIFSESNDSWRDIRLWLNNIGHVYCSHTLDPATGDKYFLEWSDSSIQRYERASDAWISNTASANTSTWGTGARTGIAWHPNLFGTGDGGIVVFVRGSGATGGALWFWRKATNAWSGPVSVGTLITSNTSEPTALYSPALDAVICGGGSNATNDLIRVNSPSSIVEIAAAPVRVGNWTSSSSQRSPITTHPVSGKPMILERSGSGGSGTNRVWIYEQNFWDLQGYTHPFDTWPSEAVRLWTVCTIPEYGVVAALIGLGDDTCNMALWKPNS